MKVNEKTGRHECFPVFSFAFLLPSLDGEFACEVEFDFA